MATQRIQQTEKNKVNIAENNNIREKAVSRNDWQNIPVETKETSTFSFPGFNELKNLIAFLLLNLIALSLVSSYPAPTAELRATLGIAPPLLWINLACSIYLFTELILIFCRTRVKNTDSFALKQIFFLTTLYIFYWYAGALQEHFAILLAIGGLLQLFECFARKNQKPATEVESA